MPSETAAGQMIRLVAPSLTFVRQQQQQEEQCAVQGYNLLVKREFIHE